MIYIYIKSYIYPCIPCSHARQPKPILLEKQFSEPNSPITKDFDPIVQQQQQHQHMEHHQHHAHGSQQDQKRPPMHRGYSDLGNRIKKRVTLRYVNSNVEMGFMVVIAPPHCGYNMESVLSVSVVRCHRSTLIIIPAM